MNIDNTKLIQEAARRRLRDAQSAKRIAAVFAAVVLGMSVLLTLLGILLDMQMEQAIGLSGMGRRTMLSSLQSMLPYITALITLCVELGYQASMLRVARGQYVSVQSLRLGFDRFWLLLRCTVLKYLMLMGTAMVSIYLAYFLFMLTPWSDKTVEILHPIMENATLLNPEIVLDEVLYGQLLQSMIPYLILCCVVMLVMVVPVLYRLRLTSFLIIDKPGIGAMGALRESRKLMKGNCLKFLRLDVSLWWFYLGSIATTVLCYGDMLLSIMGVELPISGTAAYYLFYVLYIAAEFAVYYFLRNPAEVSYAIAYDAVRPKETTNGGAVLGSIFHN